MISMDSSQGASSGAPHIPVMLDEVLRALAPRDGEVYIDGTLGAGGYTRAILDAADCRVIAIDRDPQAHAMAESWKAVYGDRLTLVHDAFGNVADCVTEKVDGFVLDLGVSSMQLDQRERGFSFRFDGPLDMRMDTSRGDSAQDIVNRSDEADLADLIYKYGEERHSRRIARAIVAARPVTSTGQLASIIRSVLPRAKDGIDPATRTFQGLRIAVNDELGELERALNSAEEILKPGGRLVVVTFHSLEDRIVKTALKDRSADRVQPSRHLPVQADTGEAPVFTLLYKKAQEPTEDEMRRNLRARSAKLRAAIRTDAKAQRGRA